MTTTSCPLGWLPRSVLWPPPHRSSLCLADSSVLERPWLPPRVLSSSSSMILSSVPLRRRLTSLVPPALLVTPPHSHTPASGGGQRQRSALTFALNFDSRLPVLFLGLVLYAFFRRQRLSPPAPSRFRLPWSERWFLDFPGSLLQ